MNVTGTAVDQGKCSAPSGGSGDSKSECCGCCGHPAGLQSACSPRVGHGKQPNTPYHMDDTANVTTRALSCMQSVAVPLRTDFGGGLAKIDDEPGPSEDAIDLTHSVSRGQFPLFSYPSSAPCVSLRQAAAMHVNFKTHGPAGLQTIMPFQGAG